MKMKRALVAISAAGLGAAAVAVLPMTHVAAGSWPSTACEDASGNDDVPIMTSPFTLGVEIASPALAGVGFGGYNGTNYVTLCYSTTPYGSPAPEITGGQLHAGVSNGGSVIAYCAPDSNQQAVALSCGATLGPTYTLTPGPPGSLGDTITVSIPFGVCLPQCTGTTLGVGATGILVGQLTPISEPGIGIGYQLSSLQVDADGTAVSIPVGPTGAYVNPFGAIIDNLSLSQGGPCVLGTCVPGGYVEIPGGNVAGVQLDGTAFNVALPKECVYSNPNGQCP